MPWNCKREREKERGFDKRAMTLTKGRGEKLIWKDPKLFIILHEKIQEVGSTVMCTVTFTCVQIKTGFHKFLNFNTKTHSKVFIWKKTFY